MGRNINQLPLKNAGSLTGTEELLLQEAGGGVNIKTTVDDLKAGLTDPVITGKADLPIPIGTEAILVQEVDDTYKKVTIDNLPNPAINSETDLPIPAGTEALLVQEAEGEYKKVTIDNLPNPAINSETDLPTPAGTESFLIQEAEGDYKKITLDTILLNILYDIVADITPELGGELDAGAHSIGFTAQTTTGTGTTTIDWKLGNKFNFAFGAFNETFTFTAPSNSCNILLKMLQDDPGSRTVTWPANVKWPDGSPPTLSTAANSIDIISFYFDGTDYYGAASLDFS